MILSLRRQARVHAAQAARGGLAPGPGWATRLAPGLLAVGLLACSDPEPADGGSGAGQAGAVNAAGGGVAGAAAAGKGGAAGGGASGQGGAGAGSLCGSGGSCEWLLKGANQTSEDAILVRFESDTRALVAPPFGSFAEFEVTRTDRDAIEVQGAAGGPSLTVSGPIELRPLGPAGRYMAIVLSRTAGGQPGGPAHVVEQKRTGGCLQTPSAYTVDYATGVQVNALDAGLEVTADAVRAGVAAHPVVPWSTFTLRATRPITGDSVAALSQATVAEGQAVAATWTPTPDQALTFGARAAFADWAPLIGQTVHLEARAEASNGVASAVTRDFPVLEFGPARASLSLVDGPPADLETWGTLQPRGPSACASDKGCTGFANFGGSGFAVRLARAGMTGLRVRYHVPDGTVSFNDQPGRLRVQVAVPGGQPQAFDLGETTAMTTTEVTLAAPADEVLVVVPVATGMSNPQTDPACASEQDRTTYLESVEPIVD